MHARREDSPRRCRLFFVELHLVDYVFDERFALQKLDLRLHVRFLRHIIPVGINSFHFLEIRALDLEGSSHAVNGRLNQADHDRCKQAHDSKPQQRHPMTKQDVPIVPETVVFLPRPCPRAT